MHNIKSFPKSQQTAFLEVVIPPDIIYEETSGDMMVPEGSSAKLICKARGFPKPKVWQHYILLKEAFCACINRMKILSPITSNA